VTDSVAQVPAEIAQQFAISVIPFTVNINGQPYLDGIDLKPTELYRRMRLENILPSTTAASLGQYQQAFETRLQAGAQAVLYVALSSKLSSAYNTANQAAERVRDEFPDRLVEVLDSRLAAISQGFVTIAAARAAAEGKSLFDVMQVAREASKRTGLVFTLETLEYLARGGRIGRVQGMLGTLLKFKPVIKVEHADGKYSTVGRERTTQKALAMLVSYLESVYGNAEPLWISVLHGQFQEQADNLVRMVRERLNVAKIEILRVSPVLGVHTGPKVVGTAVVPMRLMEGIE